MSEQQIREYVIAEADKLALRYHAYHNAMQVEHVRNAHRLKSPPPKVVHVPDYWSIDAKFNPFYVRCRARPIARAIAKKIADGSYAPHAPVLKTVPKHGGGVRTVAAYEVPDAAVSKLYYDRLLSKNKHRFSSFSYAYRNDRNVHFAIQDISIDLRRNARIFIAEFDFSDFFGSIEHQYLLEQMDQNGFLVSKEERGVIKAFLADREVGIPQGTSISLFLANLVCWRLDAAFEREGLKFARYADDTVVWSADYGRICKAFSLISEFSNEAGVRINPKKSDGISLITQKGLSAEIQAKASFDFLGYSLSVDSVSIKKRTVSKIKRKISYILYRNLIQPIRSKPFSAVVIPSGGEDPAFLTAIMQIRRYLYGNLTSARLRSYVAGRSKLISFKGLMSYYPLVTDVEQLTALDGWMLSTIHRALQKRAKLLAAHGFSRRHMFPFNASRDQLLHKCQKEKVHGRSLLEIPSFALIQRALALGILNVGIAGVMNPKSNKYNY